MGVPDSSEYDLRFVCKNDTGRDMDTFRQNKISSAGMILGAIAFILGIIHFSLGPFSPSRGSVESVVAREVAAVKRGIIAGLKGDEAPVPVRRERPDMDKLLDNVGRGMAVIALGCAFVGGMRKENRWGVSGALFFGGATLAFHVLVFSIGLVCGIILLLLILQWLTGGGLG